MRLRPAVVLAIMVLGTWLAAPLLADERGPGFAPLAEGCFVTKSAGCGTMTAGRLAAGDCTFSNGALFDVVTLPGVAGRTAKITLRPRSPSYSSIGLYLVPPAGNRSNTPGLTGGKFGSISFPLSAGEWRVGVAGGDLFSAGDYLLDVSCSGGVSSPGCTFQDLNCNQTADWYIDATSCKFSDNSGFSWWRVYGKRGDILRFEMNSSGFEPLFAIYQGGDDYLKVSTKENSRQASMRYTVPADGWYYLVATTVKSGVGGYYELTMTCTKSGCLAPYFTEPMLDQKVVDGRGPSIRMPIDYFNGEPLVTKLHNWDDPFSTPQEFINTTIVTLPAVTRSTHFYLEAETECGSGKSSVFTVRPELPLRRRAVRK